MSKHFALTSAVGIFFVLTGVFIVFLYTANDAVAGAIGCASDFCLDCTGPLGSEPICQDYGGSGSYCLSQLFDCPFCGGETIPATELTVCEAVANFACGMTTCGRYACVCVPIVPTSFYSCSSGSCVSDPYGGYTTENCDGECGSPPPPPPPGNPDFSLTASTPPVIYPCGSSAFDISITSLNNYSGYVNLFYDACPAAASCTLTPDYLYVSASTNGVVSQFKATDTCDTPTGGYPITITATDSGNNISHQSSSTLVVGTCWPRNAACINMTVPGTVLGGHFFPASITMKNPLGYCNWRSVVLNPSYPDRLGSQNPENNLRWGLGRVELPVNTVFTNTTTTFNFNALAPLTIGTYPFDWKMLSENYIWYGQTCTASINVTQLSISGDCDPPPGGDYTITKNCSFPGTVNGVDNGSLTIMPGVTFTVKTGQTIVWNSAKNIIPEGSIVFIGTGRFLKTNLWMVDSDVNGWPANFTQYYGDSTASLSDGINAPAACSSCRRRIYMNSIVFTMAGSN